LPGKDAATTGSMSDTGCRIKRRQLRYAAMNLRSKALGSSAFYRDEASRQEVASLILGGTD
jgi:hypothetical protein